jgi:hypothetical protein
MTAQQAAMFAGCSDVWMRKVLAAGRYAGYRTYKANGRQTGGWLTTRAEAAKIRSELSTRAIANAGSRKTARKPASRRAAR